MSLFKSKNDFDRLKKMLHEMPCRFNRTGTLADKELYEINKNRQQHKAVCGLFLYHEHKLTTVYLFDRDLELMDVVLMEMDFS